MKNASIKISSNSSSSVNATEAGNSLQLQLIEGFISSRSTGVKYKDSYTNFLFNVEEKELARLIADEALQLGIAIATNGSKQEIIAESADLFYNVMVALKRKNASVQDVMSEIVNRIKDSATASELKKIEQALECVVEAKNPSIADKVKSISSKVAASVKKEVKKITTATKKVAKKPVAKKAVAKKPAAKKVVAKKATSEN